MTPADDELLQSIADLYAVLDPAPDDLAEGALARLAVEGLETEYELLTLVERIDVSAGTRSGTDVEAETTATVALEFAGSAYRILLRISSIDGVRRVDGWVVPAVPVRVFLGPASDDLTGARHSASADAGGRFEFSAPMSGEVRLWLLPHIGEQPGEQPGPTVPPFVTPPFLV